MALDEMFQALEAEAAARYERIARKADEEAQTLLDAARERRTAIREDAVAKIQTTLVAERAKRLARANFAVRKELIMTREAMITKVFALVREKLSKVRQMPCYPQVFEELLQEALEGVSGNLRVLVDPMDAKLAGMLLAKLGITAELQTTFSTLGGLCIELDGGRVVIDNTLEARLARAEIFLRPEVNKSLFG